MDRIITVPGMGNVLVAPDVADVRLGVSITRPTVAEARTAAAERSSAILDAVTRAGVDRADVRTASLTVQPEYDYRDRSPVLRGQQVSHQYLVTVRALERLGAVIDDALAAGATTLDGVAFRNADPAAAERAARVAAVADARARAEVLAGEAGVRVRDVVAIVEGAAPGIPRPMMATAKVAMADAAPTPVEAGTAEVTISVVVTFSISD